MQGKRIIKFMLWIVCLGLLLTACTAEEGPDTEELWSKAMMDAVFSEEDELFPLVTLTKEDPYVIWDEKGERVLLLTWHDYDSQCAPGEEIPSQYGEIWATSCGEMLAWFEEHRGETEDWNLRLAQLLGVHEGEGYTRFTAFWVAPEDVIRPAYCTDVTAQMENGYDLVEDGAYKEWFDGNIIWSYFESDYPWTRLGYTYDWSGGETEYGLTEFLVSDGSGTEIAFTDTTEEFIARMEAYLAEEK